MKTKDRKCGFSSRLFKTDKIDWAIPREGVSSIVSVTNKLYFKLSKKTKEESAIINLTCANRILKLTLQPRVNPLKSCYTQLLGRIHLFENKAFLNKIQHNLLLSTSWQWLIIISEMQIMLKIRAPVLLLPLRFNFSKTTFTIQFNLRQNKIYKSVLMDWFLCFVNRECAAKTILKSPKQNCFRSENERKKENRNFKF